MTIPSVEKTPLAGVLQIIPAEVLDKHLASTNYQVQLTLEH